MIYVLLLIIILSKDTFTEDTPDKTTNEKDRPGLTPETTARTAKVGSRVSDPQRILKFEDGKCAFVIIYKIIDCDWFSARLGFT